MYIKSVLELDRAYASISSDEHLSNSNKGCDVKCSTYGLIKNTIQGQEIACHYVISSIINLPVTVVSEFIKTQCHALISSSTCFNANDEMAHGEIVSIFKKVHTGYLELIACRAEHIEREYILPQLKTNHPLNTTPPNTPFDDKIFDVPNFLSQEDISLILSDQEEETTLTSNDLPKRRRLNE